MKNKIFIVILSILFLLFSLCSIIGLLQHRKNMTSNNKEETQNITYEYYLEDIRVPQMPQNTNVTTYSDSIEENQYIFKRYNCTNNVTLDFFCNLITHESTSGFGTNISFFTTNNFIVNPVEPHRAQFVLLNPMTSCRLSGKKREIAQKIFPDRIELKGTSVDEINAEIQKLTNDLFSLYALMGGQREDNALMPNLWQHIHIKLGQTPIRLDAYLPPEEKGLQFWEGNLEKGHNVNLDFSLMRAEDQQAFVSDVCKELGIVDLEAIEDPELKDALDPKAIGQTHFYVSPNDSLAQAYCREYIQDDRFWTENWKEELKKQKTMQCESAQNRSRHC